MCRATAVLLLILHDAAGKKSLAECWTCGVLLTICKVSRVCVYYVETVQGSSLSTGSKHYGFDPCFLIAREFTYSSNDETSLPKEPDLHVPL